MTAGAAVPRREPALSEEDKEALRHAALQFNRGHFFECHDTLEEVWSGIRGEARDFFQGLIQVAVGLYHWRNGNGGGARTMLDRGLKRLDRYPAAYCGLDLASVRLDTAEARRRVAAGEAFPEDLAGLPRYQFTA